MNVFDDLKTNYNYYPNAAMELSIIAYELIDAIKFSVKYRPTLEQNVVWGPAELTGISGAPYSKMLVTKSTLPGSNEYFVAIQGINPLSTIAWTEEDFDISTTEPLAQVGPPSPSTIPEDVVISKGIFKGLNFLLELTDPDTGQTMTDFLQGESPEYVYVTGHSLRGTLAPPMFA